MNKRAKKLILLILVALLLVAACVIVSSLNKSEDPVTPDDKTIIVASFDVGDVTSLEYSYNGSTLAFTDNAGQWSFISDPEFPLTQNILTTIISDCSVIKATRKLDDAEDASVYGFDTPALSVRFKTSDLEYYFELGNVNSYNGGYYLRYNEEIYVTDESLFTAFSKNLFDYLTTTQLPTFEKIISFNIDTAEITDAESVAELSEAFASIVRGEVADYRSKESYGFDGTQHTVTLSYQKESTVNDENGNAISSVAGEYTYTFEFAELDGNYYIMLMDDDLIYKADGLSAFLISDKS